MEETFIDIIGYESLYQISNFGNVKSLPKGDGNGNRERLLKIEVQKKSATNYGRVALCKEGIIKRFQVHRLVAVHFMPNPDNKPFVNHIDNNGENNHILNLEWCTQVENMAHSSKQGRQDLTRSMGGIAAAKAKEDKFNVLNTALIGTVIGQLTIIGYFRAEGRSKGNAATFTCKCTCGNVVDKLKYNLFSPTRSKMCNECSFKRRKDKDIVSTA